jgi:antitoxin VapB
MRQTAKLFSNGHSQAVRLPKEFRFDGREVGIHRQGNTVVLTPLHNPWKIMFEKLDDIGLSGDFMEDREQPAEQERPELDDLFR